VCFFAAKIHASAEKDFSDLADFPKANPTVYPLSHGARAAGRAEGQLARNLLRLAPLSHRRGAEGEGYGWR
jgi:hypothetical protein